MPLVLGPDGARLAKRHGAVTLADRAARGEAPADVLGVDGARASASRRRARRSTPPLLLERFDPAALPRDADDVATDSP